MFAIELMGAKQVQDEAPWDFFYISYKAREPGLGEQ